jgi:hypothetical protein
MTAQAGRSRPLIGAALAGAATGARSFTGLAALTLAARRDAAGQPDRTLARPWVKAAAGALAAQECVLDTGPGAPSRLAVPGLAARLAGAAAAAVIIARRSGQADRRPAGPAHPGRPGLPDPNAAADPGPAADPEAAADPGPGVHPGPGVDPGPAADPEPGVHPEAAAGREPAAGAARPGTPARLAACVVVAVGVAAATAWAGTRWRAWAAGRLGHDWVGAGLEDAAAVILAAAAVRSE